MKPHCFLIHRESKKLQVAQTTSKGQGKPMCSGHTTTILANPPILLDLEHSKILMYPSSPQPTIGL